jgi:hypothetical protein
MDGAPSIFGLLISDVICNGESGCASRTKLFGKSFIKQKQRVGFRCAEIAS